MAMAKKKKKAEEKLEEKHFVVSFSEIFRNPRQKRAYRAINYLKRFVFKHFRIAPENVAISMALNEAVWAKGREHIPRKIEIKIVKEKEKASVYLKEEKIKKPKKEEEKKKEEKKAEEKEKTGEAAAEKEEIERKKKEKKVKEKAAEAAEIKRGIGKEK